MKYVKRDFEHVKLEEMNKVKAKLNESRDFKSADRITVSVVMPYYSAEKKKYDQRTLKISGKCIAVRNNGLSSSFTIMTLENLTKRAEATFPTYSTALNIKVESRAKKHKKSKCYHLRNLQSKKAALY